MILHESITINAPATAVFRFFDHMTTNYTRWHPDHHAYRWVEATCCQPGAIFEFNVKQLVEAEMEASSEEALK